jgi:hypothetical protein
MATSIASGPQRTGQMEAMRREGKTLREIGDVFGVTDTRVGQILGTRPAATKCRECGSPLPEDRDPALLHCSAECRGKADNRPRNCARCGRRSKGTYCRPCRNQIRADEAAKKYDRLEELWAQGVPAKDIASEFGVTTNALGTLVVKARSQGRDLPKRGAKKRTANLTHEQARRQLRAQIYSGKIRRPARCEECGEKTFVEGHHVDYQRPLYVFWICGPCHDKAHGKRSYESTPGVSS